ncbi:hypothetical protein ACFVSN_30575 [Kitasatospora sp. NPDC057904]|uniref:hypothetical protein n=1 Tax=unclassified Kitasatospora TaxID=2633591 RepID=UPI0036DAFBDD
MPEDVPPLRVLAWDLEDADQVLAAEWLRDQDHDVALLWGLDTRRFHRFQEAVARHCHTQRVERRDRCAAVVLPDDGPLVVGYDFPPYAAPWPFAAQVSVRLRDTPGGRGRSLLRLIAAAPCTWAPQRADTEARWLAAIARHEHVLVAGGWPANPDGDDTDTVLTDAGLPAIPATTPPDDRPHPGRIHISTTLLPAVTSLTTPDDPELRDITPHPPLLAALDWHPLRTGLAVRGR